MKKSLLGLLFLSTIVFGKEVTVSILPQKYFVQKIVGDKFDVNVMVKPGASPATYEPKVSQMRKLSKSEIYFAIDVPFEKVWLERFASANKKMLIVDTDEGIKKLEMAEHSHGEEEGHDEHKEHAKHDEHDHEKHEEYANHEKHDDHDHDGHKEHAKHDDHDHDHEKHAKHDDHDEHDEHEEKGHDGHDHGGLDPHIWLDPILVKTQAKNILKAVVAVDKANKVYYEANYEKFLKELDALDSKIKKILASAHDKAFMVFHPSWGYFAKRYDLEQIAIEVQGKEPKPAQLVELVNEAKLHNIKIVFVAPQFSQKGAKTISKAIKGNVATMNPLEIKWDENLIKVANEIAKSYK